MDGAHPDADFDVRQSETPGETLLCGFTSYGLAGLTAVDYLVDQLDLEETGHIAVEGLPSITPFVEGTPSHHTRLFSRPDLDVTVLAAELFVPVALGDALGEAILTWTEANGVEEIAVLSGVPVQHGPDEHRTYYVATEDYQATRLAAADADVPPMGRGFLDGVRGALVERGISSPLGVCVFVTPVHAQVPDAAAAVRLVETVEAVYDLGVDPAPLHEFADEVARYYAELSQRMESQERREGPEDRMYM